jgi:hypothetical protein
MKAKQGHILRTSAIVLMGLTAAMNVLGGTGTVCAAFLTKKFPPMWALLDYQWLYQTLMIVTILLGGAGIWATVQLIRGGDRIYQNSLILLFAGTVVGAIHVYASLSLRGKAIPANFKLYANAVTLLFFLILRFPGIKDRVDFSRPGEEGTQKTAGGLAALLIGFLMITTSQWVGSSHVFEGRNWVYVLDLPLTLGGSGMILGGIIAFIHPLFDPLAQALRKRRGSRPS